MQTLARVETRISLLYMMVASLWVLLSDWLIENLLSGRLRVLVSTSKGVLFVVVMAAGLYVLLRRYRLYVEKTQQSTRANNEYLEAIVQSAPLAIYILDAETRVKLWNPASERLYGWQAHEIMNKPFPSIAPERREEFVNYSARVFKGETILNLETQRIHRNGKTIEISLSVAPVSGAQHGQRDLLVMAMDVTQRRAMEHIIDSYLKRLALLNDMQHALLRGGTPEEIARQAIAQFHKLINCECVLLGLLNPTGDALDIMPGSFAFDQHFNSGERIPLTQFDEDYIDTIMSGRFKVVNEAASVQHLAPFFEELRLKGMRSFTYFPLMTAGKAIGVLNLASAQPNAFSVEHIELEEEFSVQMAVALNQAQLHARTRDYTVALESRVRERTAQLEQLQEAEHEQRLLAESLRDIATVLNQTLDTDEVLDQIIESVANAIPHENINIMIVEDGQGRVVRSRQRENSDLFCIAQTLPLAENKSLRAILSTRQALLIPDTHAEPTWELDVNNAWIRSYLGTPILMENRVIGIINLCYSRPNAFTAKHLDWLKVFSTQAAVALQNATLYQRAGELAVMEERQRLARDLHDAVTQTMFSASVVSETLLRLWEKDPNRVREGLQQLHQLTRGAVAEMRSLLLELRPNAIETSELPHLIRQLGEAFESRTAIKPLITIPERIDIPPLVKVALYRIAQEALNNVSKHSAATDVIITLFYDAKQTLLKIKDNGCGFDINEPHPGHLGLKIMQERADAIGASLTIDSTPKQGTSVTVTWSL